MYLDELNKNTDFTAMVDEEEEEDDEFDPEAEDAPDPAFEDGEGDPL